MRILQYIYLQQLVAASQRNCLAASDRAAPNLFTGSAMVNLKSYSGIVVGLTCAPCNKRKSKVRLQSGVWCYTFSFFSFYTTNTQSLGVQRGIRFRVKDLDFFLTSRLPNSHFFSDNISYLTLTEFALVQNNCRQTLKLLLLDSTFHFERSTASQAAKSINSNPWQFWAYFILLKLGGRKRTLTMRKIV